MDLYNKDKKKKTDNHSNHQTEFGDIRREIDGILNDTSKSTGNEEKYSQYEDAKEDTLIEKEQKDKENQRDYSSESSTPHHETPPNEDVYEINNDVTSGIDAKNKVYRSDNQNTSDYSENDELKEMHDTSREEYENSQAESNNNYKFELSLPKLKAEKHNPNHTTSDSKEWNQSNQANVYLQENGEKTKGVGKKMKSFSLFSKKKKQSSKNVESSKFTKDTHNEQGKTNHDIQSNDGAMDEEVLKLLGITDELLGKLPEDVINEFASSEEFDLYKRVMNRYNIIK